MSSQVESRHPVATVDRCARVERVFNELTADNLDLLDDFYADDVEFQDPVVAIDGIDALRRYYAGLYGFVESIRFDFKEIVERGDALIAVWTMHLRSSGLRKGQTIELPGVSHLRFDVRTDKVVYHRDYFDMGAFVYEHVPVLGPVVRLVNRKLREHGAGGKE